MLLVHHKRQSPFSFISLPCDFSCQNVHLVFGGHFGDVIWLQYMLLNYRQIKLKSWRMVGISSRFPLGKILEKWGLLSWCKNEIELYRLKPTVWTLPMCQPAALVYRVGGIGNYCILVVWPSKAPTCSGANPMPSHVVWYNYWNK